MSPITMLLLLSLALSGVLSLNENARNGRGGKGGRGGRGNRTPSPVYATPTTSTTTTASPGTGTGTTSGDSSDDCEHRHRKSWSTLSQTERDLYINGFKALADQGITQQLALTHYTSAQHSNSQFLPWHRHFLYMLEEEIRGLGGEYGCFAMPYWDWTDEPTPNDIATDATKELTILHSGLGGDSNGKCLTDGIFADYSPQNGNCLRRDMDYSVEPSDCSFTSASTMIQIIDHSDSYAWFRPTIEARPHAQAHICIGGDLNGQMATFYSPDDPIFWLHHCWIDYVWALWQDCHNYDDYEYTSFGQAYSGDIESLLTFRPYTKSKYAVKKTFDIENDYDVSYEKGPFWNNAFVDSEQFCGTNTETNWFYDENPGQFDGMDSERGSAEFASHSFEALLAANPDKSVDEVKVIWDHMVCEFEELERGTCELPQPDYDDCSSMALDPETNDIDITEDELLAREGISVCMKQTVNEYYHWAKMTHTLKDLCIGCYDPFCDRSFFDENCGASGMNSNEWKIAANDIKNAQEIMDNVNANAHISNDILANSEMSVNAQQRRFQYIGIGVVVAMVLCLCVTARQLVAMAKKERSLMVDDDAMSSYNAI